MRFSFRVVDSQAFPRYEYDEEVTNIIIIMLVHKTWSIQNKYMVEAVLFCYFSGVCAKITISSKHGVLNSLTRGLTVSRKLAPARSIHIHEEHRMSQRGST